MVHEPKARQELVHKLRLKHIPILEDGVKLSRFKSFDDFQAFANGESLNPSTKREGVVFKTKGFSFKVISNEWLLKNERE